MISIPKNWICAYADLVLVSSVLYMFWAFGVPWILDFTFSNLQNAPEAMCLKWPGTSGAGVFIYVFWGINLAHFLGDGSFTPQLRCWCNFRNLQSFIVVSIIWEDHCHCWINSTFIIISWYMFREKSIVAKVSSKLSMCVECFHFLFHVFVKKSKCWIWQCWLFVFWQGFCFRVWPCST